MFHRDPYLNGTTVPFDMRDKAGIADNQKPIQLLVHHYLKRVLCIASTFVCIFC